MTKYKSITDDQVRYISSKYYQSREQRTQHQSMPQAVLIAGQPGSGKSQVASLVREQLRSQGGYIHVDADRMREELPLNGTKPTSQETQGDAGRLVAALRNMAVTNRRNIIEEGTFRDADMAGRLIAGIKEHGYKVNMLIVATPPEQSLLGIYRRYEEQMKTKSANPRLVPEDYHDKVVLSFEETLAKNASSLDSIKIINRYGAVLFDSAQSKETNALDALKAARMQTN